MGFFRRSKSEEEKQDKKKPKKEVTHQDMSTEPSEVEFASEDALFLSLQEDQTGKIGLAEDEIDVISTGKFQVKNLGEVDRIWDIDIHIKNTENTELDDYYLIKELGPQEEWVKEYEIESEDELPFEFGEVINTQPDQDETNNVLVFGKEMETKLSYSFTAKQELQNITIRKKLPVHFQNTNIEYRSVGEANLSGDELVWEIEELEAGEEASLEFSTVINVEDVEPKRSGTASISSESKVEGALSGIDIDKADGYTKNYIYIEADELDDHPDIWKCNLVFENPSEFPIELKKVKVWSLVEKGDPDDPDLQEETVFYERTFEPMEQIVLSGQKWETEEPWEYEHETLPSFKREVLFTVKPEILYNTTSSIDLTDLEMPVARLEGAKKYGVEVLPSYRKTPVPTMLRFANVGSVKLKETKIMDEIPEGLEPPEYEDVHVYILKVDPDETLSDDVPGEENLVDDDDYDVDFSGYEEGQLLTVTITRLIEPNEVIYIDYSPMAMKPNPEDTFKGDGRLKAELVVPAPPLEMEVTDWISTEEVTVSHIRRKITTGKNVFPGASSGEYEIVLIFKNRGDITLEDINVRDLIPENFELLTEDMESTVKPVADGNLRTWIIDELEPGEDVKLSYTIKGTGEYKASKAQVSY